MLKKLFFKSLLTVIVLLWGIGRMDAQTKETFPYVQRDSTLYLDVYQPANPREDRAAVISVFGGGFVMGNRDDALQSLTAKMLSERGFVVISIDYRLGLKDSAKVSDSQKLLKIDDLFQYCIDLAVEDCAAAIAWVCAHAADFGIDTSKIILTGNSAGAITVLQLDYYRANSLPLSSILPGGWKPAAIIPYAGGILCKKCDLKYGDSPAPTMFMHGVEDKIVAYKHFGVPFRAGMNGSCNISKRFEKQDIPHWIIRFKGIGHEVAGWFPNSVELFCCFVDQVFAGRVSHLDAVMTDKDLIPTKWTTMNMFKMYRGED